VGEQNAPGVTIFVLTVGSKFCVGVGVTSVVGVLVTVGELVGLGEIELDSPQDKI
jgi:hypothetical protein